jgi:hypothetical protein
MSNLILNTIILQEQQSSNIGMEKEDGKSFAGEVVDEEPYGFDFGKSYPHAPIQAS